MSITAAGLKAAHVAVRGEREEPFNLRIHRAISWLTRAEAEPEDDDAAFMFLWVAFNAAYARDLGRTEAFSERAAHHDFFSKLADCDSERLIYKAIWSDFANAIRVLMDNRYVFPEFWDFQAGKCTAEQWKDAFARRKQQMNRALAEGDTAWALAIVFERLYTLRNQLVHGGATWNSKVNRDQVRDGRRILETIVPLIVKVMIDSEGKDWGEPAYPVVKD
jgi:hypothetical protein